MLNRKYVYFNVLALLFFLLAAIIFSGCMLWDIDNVRENAWKNGGNCVVCRKKPCVCNTFELPVTSVIVQAEGDASIIYRGEKLQLLAVVEPSGFDHSVTWDVYPAGQGVIIDDNGLLKAAIDAAASFITVRAASVVIPNIFGELTLQVENLITGSVEDGEKDESVNAGYVRTGVKIFSMAEDWIVDKVNGSTIGINTNQIIKSGSADIVIINNGINIINRINDYDTIDIKLIGALGIPGVILTDNVYRVTVYGIVLLETSEAAPVFRQDGYLYSDYCDPVTVSGAYPVFRLVYETRWDHPTEGLRVFLGNGNFDPFRVTLIEVEEVKWHPACECPDCYLNGMRIGEANNAVPPVKCACVIRSDCNHNCYVCLNVGRVLPEEDTTVPYIVPAAGEGFFYLDLNDCLYQYDVLNFDDPGAGIPRPIVLSSADSVTYTFYHQNQMLWIKLSDEQIVKFFEAGSVNIEIDGAAAPDSQFRYLIAMQAITKWNLSDSTFVDVFSSILSFNLIRSSNEITADENAYFTLQLRNTSQITDVTINSIKVIY